MTRTVSLTPRIVKSLLAALAVASCSSPGGSADAGSAPSNLALSSGGKDAAKTWFVPLNASNNKLALFSEQREPMNLKNQTSKTVTVKSIALTPAAGNLPEEWSLQKYDIKAAPLEANGSTLAAGASLDFYVRFYPVLGTDRAATLKIDTDAGALEVALSGRGAPDSAWAAGTTDESELVLGTPNKEELVGTSVVDSSGAQFVTANVDFSTNEGLLVSKVSADGKLSWSKHWNGPFKDRARDPGQNAESGGGANSLSLDSAGNAYVVASVSTSNANSLFWGGIAKVKTDGTLGWAKLWGYGDPKVANQNAELYGVDASGSLVYAVGTTGGGSEGGEALVLFLALDPNTGTVKAKKAFDLNPTVNDRGYAVRGDGKGNVYIAGMGGSNALLVKIKTADTNPTLEWAKSVGLGVGGNLNALDVDKDGNVYVGLDVRGSLTAFAVGRFAPDGTLAWSKQFTSGSGEKNNVHVVRVFDGKLWVGGRIFMNGFDGQMGDGLVARLGLDGSLEWSAFHFSGKGSDELAEHRVKGITAAGGKVRIASQVYTGNMNGVRYSGYWYGGQAALGTITVNVADLKSTKEYALGTGAMIDAASKSIAWEDPPAGVKLQGASAKKDGLPPDSDVMLTTLAVQ
jgi:hypothetical protein